MDENSGILNIFLVVRPTVYFFIFFNLSVSSRDSLDVLEALKKKEIIL